MCGVHTLHRPHRSTHTWNTGVALQPLVALHPGYHQSDTQVRRTAAFPLRPKALPGSPQEEATTAKPRPNEYAPLTSPECGTGLPA